MSLHCCHTPLLLAGYTLHFSQYVSGKSGVVFDKVEKLVELGITPEELFGENVGKKMRDAIIRDYLSKSGEITNQNSLEIVKEGLIEILKRI